jgi:MFS family permease
MLGVFVGALGAGYISDCLGRRPVLLAGLLVFVLSQLAIVHVESLVWVYALRFIAGLSGAAIIPVATALVAERSRRGDTPRRMAFLGAASLLGFLIGPGLVSLPRWIQPSAQMSPIDPAALFSFAMHATAALGVLVLVAIWRVSPGRPFPRLDSDSKTKTKGATSYPLRVLLALNFSTLLGLGGFEVAVSLYGGQQLRLDPLQISLMFAECSIVMLVINGLLFLTPLSRWVRVRSVLIAGLATMIVGLVLLYRGGDYAWALAAVSLVAAGSGMAMPMITWSAASNMAPLGITMGQLTAVGSLGQAVGSVAGGWIFGALSTGSFLIAALFMSLALFVAWIGGGDLPAIAGPAPQPGATER